MLRAPWIAEPPTLNWASSSSCRDAEIKCSCDKWVGTKHGMFTPEKVATSTRVGASRDVTRIQERPSRPNQRSPQTSNRNFQLPNSNKKAWNSTSKLKKSCSDDTGFTSWKLRFYPIFYQKWGSYHNYKNNLSLQISSSGIWISASKKKLSKSPKIQVFCIMGKTLTPRLCRIHLLAL